MRGSCAAFVFVPALATALAACGQGQAASIDAHAGDAHAGDAQAGDARGTCGLIPYMTHFDTIEQPISEGDVWSHVGLDWTRVETSGGIAYGTQTGTGGYDDSYAHLCGYPPDQ